MSRISPWVKSHAWTATIAAFVVGLLLGAGSGPEGGDTSLEANLVSAQNEASDMASELSAAEAENSELQADKEELASDASELRSELTQLQRKFKVMESRQPLPDLVGMTKGALEKLASKKGWTIVYSKQVSSAVAAGAVLSHTPAPGATVHDGSTIRIVVAKAPPAPKPAPAADTSTSSADNCTLGYDPCLPPASDYDCAGGSGDGPKYTGPVRVTGSDPYDLDSDGDGYGCES